MRAIANDGTLLLALAETRSEKTVHKTFRSGRTARKWLVVSRIEPAAGWSVMSKFYRARLADRERNEPQ